VFIDVLFKEGRLEMTEDEEENVSTSWMIFGKRGHEV
jgi:hypothetical protein